MSTAFSQALARGLGAHSSSGVPVASSSAGHSFVPQTKGDPNYYATVPQFDSRGFWHATGTNPPSDSPKGEPATPLQGAWTHHGTTKRNGQATTLWVWYPPTDKSIIMGVQKPGEHNYLVARKKPTDSAKQLFSNYWVHEYIVSSPTKSSYKPQALKYDTVEGIVPVVGTFQCQHWLIVEAQNKNELNATLDVLGMFKTGSVFDYYQKYVGISPYFTWNGYLFKFEYTGYDAKTGKYRHGNQYTYVISICTDGLNVQKNPPGDVAKYTVFAPGGAGGELVVHQPRGVHGVGRPKESEMESVFNSALRRGLGLAPKGLGQIAQFSAGGNGTARLSAIPASNLPRVNASDWTEFYPSDPNGFRANTNLALSASEQASSLGTGAFYGANPIGGAIVTQVTATAPNVTTYWTLVDPNNRAAYTIGTGGNETGNGSSPGIAIIRSSYVGGALKLEIALRTIPRAIDKFTGWPTGATIVGASSVAPWADWVQLTGPVGGDLTAADMPGQSIALSGTDVTGIISAYLQYLNQPQFLQTIPSAAWGPWAGGFGVTRGGHLVIPTVYFTYGGQSYKVFWFGEWIAGQVGGAPNSGPAIDVANLATSSPKPKSVSAPLPPPLTLPTIPVSTIPLVPTPIWSTPSGITMTQPATANLAATSVPVSLCQ